MHINYIFCLPNNILSFFLVRSKCFKMVVAQLPWPEITVYFIVLSGLIVKFIVSLYTVSSGLYNLLF